MTGLAPDLGARPVRVAYLACVPRSGTTVISRVAHTHPDVVAVGELVHLWQVDAWHRGDLCSCGDPLPDCAFWGEVMTAARITPADLSRVGPEVWRQSGPRSVPKLLRGDSMTVSPAAAGLLARLYAATAEVAAARVVLDSSKYPGYAGVLTEVPGCRVDVVHLVRDPVGVYASATRAKPRSDTGAVSELAARGRWATVAKWTTVNLVIAHRWPDALPVRYEDFAADPAGQWGRIADRLDLAAGDVAAGRRFTPAAEHLIGSNPDRADRGVIEIRNAAAGALPPWERGLVRIATAPAHRGRVSRP